MDSKHAFVSTMSPSYNNAQLPEYVADTSIPSIPQAFKASFGSSWSKLLCSSSKTINFTPPKSSASSTTDPSEVKISLPNGYYGSIILEHAGGKTSSPLARAIPEGRRRYDVLLPGSSVAETLRREPRKSKWWFALPIGANGELETFEWRRSRGSEVKSLGASWRGWKLVRTRCASHERQSIDQLSSKDDESLPGYSSEDEKNAGALASGEGGAGEEIVAVWAKSGTWTSLHDVGEFAFLGSGASGELGQRFAVMAVMTALSIWQKAMRDAETAGAVSAATSVTTVTVS